MKKRAAILTIIIIFVAVIITGCYQEDDANDEQNLYASYTRTQTSTPAPAPAPTPTPTPTPTLAPPPVDEFITIAGVDYSISLTELRISGENIGNGDIIPLRYMINLTTLCDIWIGG